MSNLHRLFAAVSFVVPVSAIAAGAQRAPSQLYVHIDTMRHVRADTATLAAQQRRTMSADLARQHRMDSTTAKAQVAVSARWTHGTPSITASLAV